MASLNFNFSPFNSNYWFKKPPNLFSLFDPFNPFRPQSQTPIFAALSLNPFSGKPKKVPREPGKYSKMLDQFYWECENLPDYRHTPEVERILNEDPIFEKKENPTPEEIEENEKWWTEFRWSSSWHGLKGLQTKLMNLSLRIIPIPTGKKTGNCGRLRILYCIFLKAVPNVIGLDGRPMPRKAIKTKKESDDKFWDFARQFFFGLWGFRQRPYPPGRPIDVAQAIGYKRLEKRYYDFIMRSGGWYFKDRLGRTRGPMELIQLKTAWGTGIIDKHTFIWGDEMDEWAPIGMVYGLEPAIATWEVRLGAAAVAFLHKLQKGIPSWVPLKGHEDKTYKQLQEEAYESKRRDLAVLEANNGIWPGVRIPSHALFLWAGGSELTSILEADHMPNKYIPKDRRYELAKVIPGLRPWEVLSVEQAMDQITYGGEWYREPLGSYTTGPPYIQEWNKDVKRLFEIFHNLSVQVYGKLDRTIPGFSTVMEKVKADAIEREAKRKEKRNAQKKAEQELALFGRVQSDK